MNELKVSTCIITKIRRKRVSQDCEVASSAYMLADDRDLIILVDMTYTYVN